MELANIVITVVTKKPENATLATIPAPIITTQHTSVIMALTMKLIAVTVVMQQQDVVIPVPVTIIAPAPTHTTAAIANITTIAITVATQKPDFATNSVLLNSF